MGILNCLTIPKSFGLSFVDCTWYTSHDEVFDNLKLNYEHTKALIYLWRLCTDIPANCASGHSGLQHACETATKDKAYCVNNVRDIVNKFCKEVSDADICKDLKTVPPPIAPGPNPVQAPMAPLPPAITQAAVEEATKKKMSLLLIGGIGAVALLLLFGLLVFVFCMMNNNKPPPPPPVAPVSAVRRPRKSKKKKNKKRKTKKSSSMSKVESKKKEPSEKEKDSKSKKVESKSEKPVSKKSSMKSKTPEEIV
ncbi:hypothetical protein CAEBREN_17251 [Caenorhabditis brenneri]|uniref:Uncharacterized protein n=1 Tax=Caenorhabditis brenneri TaxID=135651 RepID=G0MJ97_CAEBE|nr:hypothetical protein CAEBREN_17251 [Caenorhabditis brenneri]